MAQVFISIFKFCFSVVDEDEAEDEDEGGGGGASIGSEFSRSLKKE